MCKKFFSLMLVFVMTLALCGCGGKAELPEDTPWNNGYYAIMETENGYYSNQKFQTLRYHEKGTGTEIFLCAKPECQHDGSDTCPATYRDLRTVNSVLYDGFIYVLTYGQTEGKTAFYTLYRISLDGTSLDKVGDVLTEDNTSDERPIFNARRSSNGATPFIIHKGYAYIPFFLALKWSAMGFVNGGIMKMDIKTGKTEQIFTMENLTGAYPTKIWGCGDYVYFDLYSGHTSRTSGTNRYNIKDGTVEAAVGEYADYRLFSTTEDKLYTRVGSVYEGEKAFIEVYDSKTREQEAPIYVETDYFDNLMPYDGMFFMHTPDKLVICGETGEKLGELAYEFDGLEYVYDTSTIEREMFMRISGGKVYSVLTNMENTVRYYRGDDLIEAAYFVYSCPIEDIINGTGKWKLEYDADPRGISMERLYYDY